MPNPISHQYVPKYHPLLYSAICAADREISVVVPRTLGLLLLAKSVSIELVLHAGLLLTVVHVPARQGSDHIKSTNLKGEVL